MRFARGPLPWLAGLLVVYLAWPLAAFVVRLARSPERGFHAPGLFPALAVSLEGATISLALIALLGVPLAYALARSRSRLSSVLTVVVALPLALPPLMSGIILIYLVGPYTWLGRRFHESLTGSLAGVVIAMTFVSAPFLVVAARAAFASVDFARLEVAATLGLSETRRFWRVALPAAAPGVRAGLALAWLRAFGEYGAVVILAYNPASLPIYAYNQFSGVGLPTTLAPTAIALGAAAIVMALTRVRAPHQRDPAVPPPAPPEPAPASPVAFSLDHTVGSFRLAVDHGPSTRLAVIGASGSGKSTLLRSLAGLAPRGGDSVAFGPDDVSRSPAETRGVGYVAQGFALYPHLTVWRHLTLSPRSHDRLASHWLERLGLAGLAGRYPSELSGGQRQRVALAQALARAPRVLLLDEPLSALDVPVRAELRRELRTLQRETGIASVVVTHDPEEAAYLADEVMVIAGGRCLQAGTTSSVFARPASPEVARLLGIANLLEASTLRDGVVSLGSDELAASTNGLNPGDAVMVAVRPERVALRAGAPGPGELAGVVTAAADVGAAVDYRVELGGGARLLARSSGARLAEG
ncbi:MAG TPA: ATP-binding cassette domain-containing protein, partial [Acidimicrobiales bacterium]|nr:ATP-binding cassette domain-containing protein [Acidimicrobiales bacterium]